MDRDDYVYAVTVLMIVPATLLLLLLMSSCGEHPSYTTVHGHHVYDSPGHTDQAEVERVTEYAMSHLSLVERDKVERRLSRVGGIEVNVRKKPRPWRELDGTEVTVAGWAGPLGFVVVVRRDQCLAETAYVHELVHILHYHIYRDSAEDYEDALCYDHEWHHDAFESVISQRFELCEEGS